MKIEPILDSVGVMINVSKTLLCNDHKPPGARPFQPMIDNSIDNDGRPPAPPKDKSRPKSQAQGCRRRRDRKNASAEIDQSTCNVPLIPIERLALTYEFGFTSHFVLVHFTPLFCTVVYVFGTISVGTFCCCKLSFSNTANFLKFQKKFRTDYTAVLMAQCPLIIRDVKFVFFHI